jgi:sugar fermentation stimulation protein A
VWYSSHEGARRKYKHTLEIVATPRGDLVCIHSARANAIVAEALERGTLPGLTAERFEREVAVPDGGRIDFRLHTGGGRVPCYLEVKCVTLLCEDATGAFPDAPSTRARRHLDSLVALRARGFDAALLFCVQHTGIERVRAASEIDPEYAAALRAARVAGVQVLACRARPNPVSMEIDDALPVDC